MSTIIDTLVIQPPRASHKLVADIHDHHTAAVRIERTDGIGGDFRPSEAVVIDAEFATRLAAALGTKA